MKRCCPGQADRTNIAPYILLFSVGGMLIQITKPCGCTGNAGTMPNAFVLAGHRLFAPRRTLGTRLRAHFGASTFSERLPVRSRQRRPIGFSAPLRGCPAPRLRRPGCACGSCAPLDQTTVPATRGPQLAPAGIANCRSRRHHRPRRGGLCRPCQGACAADAASVLLRRRPGNCSFSRRVMPAAGQRAGAPARPPSPPPTSP